MITEAAKKWATAHMAKSFMSWDEGILDENINAKMVVDERGASAWGRVYREAFGDMTS